MSLAMAVDQTHSLRKSRVYTCCLTSSCSSIWVVQPNEWPYPRADLFTSGPQPFWTFLEAPPQTHSQVCIFQSNQADSHDYPLQVTTFLKRNQISLKYQVLLNKYSNICKKLNNPRQARHWGKIIRVYLAYGKYLRPAYSLWIQIELVVIRTFHLGWVLIGMEIAPQTKLVSHVWGMHLPLPPECYNYICVPSHSALVCDIVIYKTL